MSTTANKPLTIVIKLGTSSICDEKTYRPLLSNLSLMVETIVDLRTRGHRVVLVTSGAIGVGVRRLNYEHKPKKLSAIQAVAAVGQGRLIRMWDDLFEQLNQPIAQILLTRNDLADRTQYRNAVNTFSELLTMGVVPIVNENDTVSVSEIRFGDNDTLSAITAGMVHADYLFLMTDVDCLFTDNPRTNPKATPIKVVEDVGGLRDNVVISSPGSTLGTGGMTTKLIAAELATAAGVTTIISRGSAPRNILDIIDHLSGTESTEDPPLHTRFLPKPNPMVDRKWWILHGLREAGTIFVDEGAWKAVTKAGQKSSLFAAGILDVSGSFVVQQPVLVVHRRSGDGGNDESVIVGKGLVNYSSTEILRIKGCHSSEITERLGYADSECVIDRDNLAIVTEYSE